nr:hypothetical protein [Candidatus Sigynarchaeota archaeon]
HGEHTIRDALKDDVGRINRYGLPLFHDFKGIRSKPIHTTRIVPSAGGFGIAGRAKQFGDTNFP